MGMENPLMLALAGRGRSRIPTIQRDSSGREVVGNPALVGCLDCGHTYAALGTIPFPVMEGEGVASREIIRRQEMRF